MGARVTLLPSSTSSVPEGPPATVTWPYGPVVGGGVVEDGGEVVATAEDLSTTMKRTAAPNATHKIEWLLATFTSPPFTEAVPAKESPRPVGIGRAHRRRLKLPNRRA